MTKPSTCIYTKRSRRRLAIEPLEARRLLANDIPPFIDLNVKPGEPFSNPDNLFEAGGKLYFSAANPTGINRLWRTDGTQAGTGSILDFWLDFFPFLGSMADVNGTLFFTQSSYTSGGTGRSESALWKSDGTYAGTVFIKDVKPSFPTDWNYSEQLTHFTSVGNLLYFVANDGTSGKELWKSDGTVAGTVMVKDIKLGQNGSNPSNLINVNGTLYFTANDGIQSGLWKSDGTDAGTIRLVSSSNGDFVDPSNLVSIGNTVYFTARMPDAQNGLWKTQGTQDSTSLVATIPSTGFGHSKLTVVGNRLFFTAFTSSTGTELWTSDGTEAGTRLVRDIVPGSVSSTPERLTNVNGTLFFTAFDSSTGQELWKSDGTESGTIRVKDIQPGFPSSNINSLTSFNGALYFVANDGTNGQELWKSDGTENGTVLLADIAVGATSSEPHQLTVAAGRLFFRAKNPQGDWQLWQTDGTSQGTAILSAPISNTRSSYPHRNLEYNGKLFFVASDGMARNSFQFYLTDGTQAGTNKFADLPPLASAFDFVNIAGTIFFQASDGNHYHLWKSDGTAEGTMRVSDVKLGRHTRARTNITPLNGIAYFAANDGSTGYELWRSDGTPEGTRVVKDLNTHPPQRLGGVYSATEFNGLLYFHACSSDACGLFKTDGTEAGTQAVRAGAGDLYFSADSMTNVAGTLFFVGTVGIDTDFGLWKSDGTTEGTVLVKQFDRRQGNLWLRTGFNGELYFSAGDRQFGYELWKSDGTQAGTVLVKDIFPGPGSSAPTNFAVVGNALYFTAFEPDTGQELWKTDGTEAGTIRVADILPGVRTSGPSSLFNANGTLYFVAYDDLHGRELWKSDGSSVGTVLALDIAADASSEPSYFVVYDNHLYFSAFTTSYGFELHRLPLNAPATQIVGSFAYYAGSPLAASGLENALDRSKRLLKESGTPQSVGFENLINSIYGITGLVFDFQGLSGNISSSDFRFQVSPQGAFSQANNPVQNWESAPEPISIAGTGGSSGRVVIEWRPGSILNRWLRVTVLANQNTGLSQPEVYYIGHLTGEATGVEAYNTFNVRFQDISAIRTMMGSTVDASSQHDIDKNGLVELIDILAMRRSIGLELTAITVGQQSAPAAPAFDQNQAILQVADKLRPQSEQRADSALQVFERRPLTTSDKHAHQVVRDRIFEQFAATERPGPTSQAGSQPLMEELVVDIARTFKALRKR